MPLCLIVIKRTEYKHTVFSAKEFPLYRWEDHETVLSLYWDFLLWLIDMVHIESASRLSTTAWIISWYLPITFTPSVKVAVCWTFKEKYGGIFPFLAPLQFLSREFSLNKKKRSSNYGVACLRSISIGLPVVSKISRLDQLGNGLSIRCFESPILHQMPIHQRCLFRTSK